MKNEKYRSSAALVYTAVAVNKRFQVESPALNRSCLDYVLTWCRKYCVCDLLSVSRSF